ncbi:MAG: LysM peptidoglycan-binding domain-containing protein [candidate division Zixibacteria bacterium]|nr:LysM peptidoglycan-binding domain-containing protein [candidate division Zixibacteria bacterium]
MTSDPGQDYIIHQVRRGETLSRIAGKYRTSITRILAANEIDDPDQLRAGDRLKIYIK